MAVNSYQQAILQEMGIPVWISKDAYLANANDKTRANTNTGAGHASQMAQVQTPPTSKPISQQDKQSRLAQLRAQVGSANESATKKASTTDAADEAMQPQSSANPASASVSQHKTSVPAPPPGIPLSAQQKQAGAQWLADVTLACVQLGLSSSQANVLIGKELAILSDTIVLPAAPEQLSAVQQRALWHALIKASQQRRQA